MKVKSVICFFITHQSPLSVSFLLFNCLLVQSIWSFSFKEKTLMFELKVCFKTRVQSERDRRTRLRHFAAFAVDTAETWTLADYVSDLSAGPWRHAASCFLLGCFSFISSRRRGVTEPPRGSPSPRGAAWGRRAAAGPPASPASLSPSLSYPVISSDNNAGIRCLLRVRARIRPQTLQAFYKSVLVTTK